MYGTIHNIVISQINSQQGKVYLPFILSFFIFILINNIIGMIPYGFATTSNFVLTFSLSLTIVLGSTILSFLNNGLKLFALLVPSVVLYFYYLY